MSGKHHQSQKAIFLTKDVDLPKDVRVVSLQMIGNGLALAETLNEPSSPAVPRTINVLPRPLMGALFYSGFVRGNTLAQSRLPALIAEQMVSL
jgi:hypothetical protein